MDKKKKILIIGGTVIAAVVITAVSFTNNRADQKELDGTYTAENSLFTDETMATNAADNNEITMASEDVMSAAETTSFNDTWEITDAIVSEIKDIVKKYYSTEDFNEDVIAADTAKVQEKVKEEITEKRSGIEAYKDIQVIVRKGLEKDTFVAFASYKTKFLNIDTLAPGMSVLYIVTNEDGKLGIQDTPDDEKLADHIDQLLKEEEITALVNNVNTGFAEAVEKDETLKAFVEKLTEKAE